MMGKIERKPINQLNRLNMKNILKRIDIQQAIRILFLLIVLLSITSMLHAAGPDDPSGPGGGDNDAPIDGGLSLLIAGGVGYGLKKMREKNKKHQSISQNE